jgi:hypothetical protein
MMVLLFIILLLLTSIAYASYYFPERHLEKSTQNINDLRETIGLSINHVLWDEKGDRLILALSDDISIVDDEFNYQATLTYNPTSPYYIGIINLLGINDGHLFVMYLLLSMFDDQLQVLVSWDLESNEIADAVNINHGRRSVNPDCSFLAIHSNETVYILDLSYPSEINTVVGLATGSIYELWQFYWINNYELKIFLSDGVVIYNVINNSYRSIAFDPFANSHVYAPVLLMSDDFHIFYVSSGFILTNPAEEPIIEVELGINNALRSLTMDYGHNYLVGSVNSVYYLLGNRLIFWDTQGVLIDEWWVTLHYHSLDWNNPKQKLAGAGEEGNFSIFTLPSLVMDAIKNKNYLIPFSVFILLGLLIYVIRKYVFRKDVDKDETLYPIVSDNQNL